MFEQSVVCPRCKNSFSMDWSDFVESSDVIDENRDMGSETAHSIEAEVTCPHCGRELHVHGAIYEYPEGAYNDNDLECVLVNDEVEDEEV